MSSQVDEGSDEVAEVGDLIEMPDKRRLRRLHTRLLRSAWGQGFSHAVHWTCT